jgi:hypothetical protein
MITCQATKGASTEYWSWRIIDNRTCWYPGHHKMEKSQLTWSKPAATEVVGERKYYSREELQAAAQVPPPIQEAQLVNEPQPQELTPQQRINEAFAVLGAPRLVRPVLYDNIGKELATGKVIAVTVVPKPIVPPVPALPPLPLHSLAELPVLLVAFALSYAGWRALNRGGYVQ